MPDFKLETAKEVVRCLVCNRSAGQFKSACLIQQFTFYQRVYNTGAVSASDLLDKRFSDGLIISYYSQYLKCRRGKPCLTLVSIARFI